MLWSAKSNSFFLPTEGALIQAPDVIAVEDTVFNEFGLSFPPPGKIRIAGKNGLPEWADIPPPAHDEILTQTETEKQNCINKANDYMNRKQWPGKAAIGRLTASDLTQYNQWLDYLDALEAVNTSSAPDINWPVSPAEQAS